MSEAWPALDAALQALNAAPSRTGSVIATVYGDAIMPRGGALALADLLVLMRRLGASEGVVRTAVSRLAKDGLIEGRRVGRRSAYALTAQGDAEFSAALPQIYGVDATEWAGRLHLAFPEPGADRSGLEQAGFALIAPGVLLSPWAAPNATLALEAVGCPASMQRIAARTWPLLRLAAFYETFNTIFEGLRPVPEISPLDALAARIALVHAWRRIALRDPRLPAGLLPERWPGAQARALCVDLYGLLTAGSETWLDAASDGAAPLPPGPDPAARFTMAGPRPAAA